MTRSPEKAILAGGAEIALSMAIIGIVDNVVRLIAAEAGVWQFHAARSLIGLPLLLLWCRWRGIPLRPRRLPQVAVRTGIQAAAMYLYFASLPMMPIAQVGASLFTAPIFVLIYSVLFFGQRVGGVRTFAVALGFAGALLVLKPEGGTMTPWVLMPLAAGAIYGMSNLLTREWCAGERAEVLVFWFLVLMGLGGILVGTALAVFPVDPALRAKAPFLFTGLTWTGPDFWLWTGLQALVVTFAIILTARGYQRGPASALSVFEYAYLAFAPLGAWLFWGDTLDLRMALGILTIAAAGILIALRG
jgi:drug/metabolite transporter (DMT)-like permease